MKFCSNYFVFFRITRKVIENKNKKALTVEKPSFDSDWFKSAAHKLRYVEVTRKKVINQGRAFSPSTIRSQIN